MPGEKDGVATKIIRIGNSRGVRIPKPLLEREQIPDADGRTWKELREDLRLLSQDTDYIEILFGR